MTRVLDSSPSLKNPHECRLVLADDGRLLLHNGAAAPKTVKVVRCFPWSEPTRYVSLRDEDDSEVAFIDTPERLDRASRHALEGALVAAGFVLNITAISSIDEDFEIRRWHVRTSQGPRTFQTLLDTWPHQTPNGRLVIEDVAGDLYVFPDVDDLDRKSQELLWAFLD